MDVTVKKDVPRLKSLTHHHLGGAVLRTLFHTGSYPLSIQIIARQRGSVVTNYDSIRVQHGDNLEYEVVSQVLGILVVTDQKLKDAFDDEARVGLSRMHPSRYHDGPSDSDVLRPRTEICYDGHFTVIQC